MAVQEMLKDPYRVWISVIHILATCSRHLEDLLKKKKKSTHTKKPSTQTGRSRVGRLAASALFRTSRAN